MVYGFSLDGYLYPVGRGGKGKMGHGRVKVSSNDGMMGEVSDRAGRKGGNTMKRMPIHGSTVASTVPTSRLVVRALVEFSRSAPPHGAARR